MEFDDNEDDYQLAKSKVDPSEVISQYINLHIVWDYQE